MVGLFLFSACAGLGAGGGPTPEPAPPADGDTPADADTPAPSDVTPFPSPRPDPRSRLRVETAPWATDFSIASVDLAEIRSGGPGKDGIPAVDAPEYESLADARTWLKDRSPVVSLELNGAARAYPLAILTWHEIANDTLGGVPVLVTFCPLCNTALVFERELDGQVYDFGTTGNLRFSNLVMYDRQTESWWQQGTGEAIAGTLTGTKLTFLPAQIISLADFALAHPDGDVLSRATGYARDYGRNPYVGYDTITSTPFLFDGEIDGRLTTVARVVTVGDQDDAIAFPYDDLRRVGAANSEHGGRPIVVMWVPGTASALDAARIDEADDAGATGVFVAELDGQRLTFERIGDGDEARIVDAETGSTWTVTGRAIDGPSSGAVLEPVVHGDHFWFSWAAFAPETEIWSAP